MNNLSSESVEKMMPLAAEAAVNTASQPKHNLLLNKLLLWLALLLIVAFACSAFLMVNGVETVLNNLYDSVLAPL